MGADALAVFLKEVSSGHQDCSVFIENITAEFSALLCVTWWSFRMEDYADFLLLMLKTVVLLNILVETNHFYEIFL